MTLGTSKEYVETSYIFLIDGVSFNQVIKAKEIAKFGFFVDLPTNFNGSIYVKLSANNGKYAMFVSNKKNKWS